MEVGIVVHRYNFIVKSISTATSQIPLGGKPSYLEETGPRIEACRLDTTFILKANKSALFETYCACSWATIASTGRLPRQGLLWVLSKVTYTWPSLQVPQVSTEGTGTFVQRKDLNKEICGISFNTLSPKSYVKRRNFHLSLKIKFIFTQHGTPDHKIVRSSLVRFPNPQLRNLTR